MRRYDAFRGAWALVGALAVSIHSEPRSTRDIDLAVALPEKNRQDDLIQAFVNRGYGHPQVLMHVMPTRAMGVRLQIRGSIPYPVALDLLFSSSGIEDEIVAAAQEIEALPNLDIPVAIRGHLIAMKVLSKNEEDRIRDESDLQQLLRGASLNDARIALQALDLIKERGFHGSKDLRAEFRASLQRYAAELLEGLVV